ncbi:MAG: hypothetical protein LBG43_04360 [Treponema sp.]|jgi:hypothetical protein|nr:hypothetical protein [Treponema sp.]
MKKIMSICFMSLSAFCTFADDSWEKEGDYSEVVRLAEQAKEEGWTGDWDKRMEKARKKLGMRE